MKKYIIIFISLIIISSLFGCIKNIKEYETNEKSNYMTNETFKGGKGSSECEIDKIWINDLIGDTKVIIDFDEIKTIPSHIINYSKENKEIILSFQNVDTSTTTISDYSSNKLIEEIKIEDEANNKSNIIIKLNKEIKYRTDETIDSSQLVLNLR